MSNHTTYVPVSAQVTGIPAIDAALIEYHHTLLSIEKLENLMSNIIFGRNHPMLAYQVEQCQKAKEKVEAWQTKNSQHQQRHQSEVIRQQLEQRLIALRQLLHDADSREKQAELKTIQIKKLLIQLDIYSPTKNMLTTPILTQQEALTLIEQVLVMLSHDDDPSLPTPHCSIAFLHEDFPNKIALALVHIFRATLQTAKQDNTKHSKIFSAAFEKATQDLNEEKLFYLTQCAKGLISSLDMDKAECVKTNVIERSDNPQAIKRYLANVA